MPNMPVHLRDVSATAVGITVFIAGGGDNRILAFESTTESFHFLPYSLKGDWTWKNMFSNGQKLYVIEDETTHQLTLEGDLINTQQGHKLNMFQYGPAVWLEDQVYFCDIWSKKMWCLNLSSSRVTRFEV